MPTRGHLLNMDNFIDTSSAEGRFDYSEWVRAYGRYLDEQLEVYAKINYYQARVAKRPLACEQSLLSLRHDSIYIRHNQLLCVLAPPMHTFASSGCGQSEH